MLDVKSKLDDLGADDILVDLKGKVDKMGEEWWDKAKQSILDEKMEEAVDFITKIIERLQTFDMPDIEYKNPRFVLLALLKKAQEYSAEKFASSLKKADMKKSQFEVRPDFRFHVLR